MGLKLSTFYCSLQTGDIKNNYDEQKCAISTHFPWGLDPASISNGKIPSVRAGRPKE